MLQVLMSKDDKREHAICCRAAELLLGEFNPLSPANFAEALSEIELSKVIEAMAQAENIQPFSIRSLAYSEVGKILRNEITAYWEKLATRKATDSVDEAVCKKCFDDGCPLCDPQEKEAA